MKMVDKIVHIHPGLIVDVSMTQHEGATANEK